MFFSSPPKICHPDKRSRTNKVLYVLFTESRNVLKLKYVNGQHHHPKRLSPFMSSVLKLKCKSAFGHNGNSTMTAYHILVIFSQRAKCWPNFSSSNMHNCSAKYAQLLHKIQSEISGPNRASFHWDTICDKNPVCLFTDLHAISCVSV